MSFSLIRPQGRTGRLWGPLEFHVSIQTVDLKENSRSNDFWHVLQRLSMV